MAYPQTKTYFSHWKSLAYGSNDVKIHGARIMGGVTEAIGKIDNLTTGLLNLSELHAFTLRVDPANFKVRARLLPLFWFIILHICVYARNTDAFFFFASLWQLFAHCILVVMANMFPAEFTPEVHMAMDKFLSAVARALSEKYR